MKAKLFKQSMLVFAVSGLFATNVMAQTIETPVQSSTLTATQAPKPDCVSTGALGCDATKQAIAGQKTGNGAAISAVQKPSGYAGGTVLDLTVLDPTQFTTTSTFECTYYNGVPSSPGAQCTSGYNQTNVVSIKDGTFAKASDVTALQNQMSQLATGNPVEYDDSTKAAITLGGATGTTISNLAAGAVNASSTDAVNGAQLYATNQLAQSAGTAATAAQNTADAAGTAAAAAQTTANSALTAANTANTTLAQGMNFTGNSGTVNNAHMGDTITIKGGLATTAAASDSNIRTVSNGDGSISVLIAESPKFGNVVINNGGKGGITGVSDGVLAAGSEDVVTGGQLYTTNQRLAEAGLGNIKGNDVTGGGKGSTATGSGTVAIGDGANASGGNVAIGHGSTATTPAIPVAGTTINNQYYGFAGSKPTETFSVGSAENPRQITNVGAGQLNADSTDAVNGSQLFATNQAVAGLGGRVNDLSTGLDSTRKEAFAGAAAAMAMQLPHTAPGKVSMGIGAGSYKGQTAGALSVKYTTKNNRFAVGGGVSYTGHGTGVNLAASWTFGSSEPAPMAQTGYDSSVYGSGYNQLNQTQK